MYSYTILYYISNKKIKKLNKVHNVSNIEILYDTTSEYTDSTDFDEELIEEVTYDTIKN
jgi:hypothetical protein